jgi:hypothetical protein
VRPTGAERRKFLQCGHRPSRFPKELAMAHVHTLIANPLALMMSPEEVIKAVEG